MTPALAALLDAALADPARRVTLAADLDAAFGRTCAPLVVDMCGFSRQAEADEAGALLEVRRMQRAGAEIIAALGGQLVKGWADNLFAVFPEVEPAREAARRLHRRVPISAGIGYGRILLPPGDLWGREINAASRLGEDVAGCGEILLTDSAKARSGAGD